MTDSEMKNCLIAILVVSAPSLPVFFIFVLISKMLNKKGDDTLINPYILKYMMCFGFGTLIGDVFLHILPHMMESTHPFN